MRICQQFLLCACISFFPLIAMASSGIEILPSYDHYKRWLIACDNGLRCEAKGMTDRHRDPHLSILRDAGPEGSIHITIVAPFRFQPSDLYMDGVALELGDAAKIEPFNSRTQVTITEPVAAQAFIQRVRNGHYLEFHNRRNRIPLAGLTAVLLRMDERQQRLGTQTALIRKGQALASSVPAPPTLPRIEKGKPAPSLSREEEEALLDTVQAFHADPLDGSCYGAMHLMTPVKAQAWPIDEHHALVAVPCTLTNIQQLQSFLYIVDRRQGGPIELFQPSVHMDSRPNPLTIRVLSEPDFDPSSGRLFMSRKILSDAVCGHAGEWQWQNGTFVLARFMFQSRCGGSTPGDWPLVYRSDTVALF